ncbi:hypothetical protein STVIR_5697 [Streptomyces viridochromogenes Tue57]|uniref:Uncharacterized protein n=1 Tax=Streptomyces viridochromogenes Tue57 TaxID=1160705 RepID=L8PAY7_STRVR|nr:hypothetical protein STVIR_5697 [Streptomyces viridochromogenes Tue57]
MGHDRLLPFRSGSVDARQRAGEGSRGRGRLCQVTGTTSTTRSAARPELTQWPDVGCPPLPTAASLSEPGPSWAHRRNRRTRGLR